MLVGLLLLAASVVAIPDPNDPLLLEYRWVVLGLLVAVKDPNHPLCLEYRRVVDGALQQSDVFLRQHVIPATTTMISTMATMMMIRITRRQVIYVCTIAQILSSTLIYFFLCWCLSLYLCHLYFCICICFSVEICTCCPPSNSLDRTSVHPCWEAKLWGGKEHQGIGEDEDKGRNGDDANVETHHHRHHPHGGAKHWTLWEHFWRPQSPSSLSPSSSYSQEYSQAFKEVRPAQRAEQRPAERAEKLEEARQPKRIRSKQAVDQVIVLLVIVMILTKP